MHALQSLILHRKICNHPYFFKDQDIMPKEPDFKKIKAKLNPSFDHSGKLLGLIEILTQCDILGVNEGATTAKDKESGKQKEGTLALTDIDAAN
jgi:SNF2 family DNA or RNA helicase